MPRLARVPATNAKPRDEFAGLHRFATCRGLISSRYRGVCRLVVTGFRVSQSGRFIDRSALHSRLHTKQLARRPLSSAPGSRLGIILGHRVEGGRYPFTSGAPATRGRAQQRNTNVATGFNNLWFENPSQAESSKCFQSTPFAGPCQGPIALSYRCVDDWLRTI